MHSALPERAMLSCKPFHNYTLLPFLAPPVLALPYKPAGKRAERSGRLEVSSAIAAPPDHRPVQAAEGHSALLQGLGELGDVTPGLMPGLLRLSHIRYVACDIPAVRQALLLTSNLKSGVVFQGEGARGRFHRGLEGECERHTDLAGMFRRSQWTSAHPPHCCAMPGQSPVVQLVNTFTFAECTL